MAKRSVDFSGDPHRLGTPGRRARSGRVVPEVGDESLREVIHGSYRIVYRLRGDIIEIATVFHDARLFRLD